MTAPHHSADHDRPEIPDPERVEVREGVFAYVQPDGSWGLNNTGFVVGSKSVTAIDTCFTERRTRAFLDAVAEVTAHPITTLVNTHHHGDHTHGNHLVEPVAIVAHQRCREEVIASGHSATAFFAGVDWGDITVDPPSVTFSDRLDLWVDDRKVELHFMGPAHTTNDVVAWLPAERVLFAGDLVFNGGTPFVVMGSVAGSLAALDRLRAFDAEVVVPGHGPVCDADVVDDQVAYLRFVQEAARTGFEAGRDPLAHGGELDLGRFAAWHDTERIVGNLHRAYWELEGRPLGSPADPQAFADMIELNGGPMRCLA